MIIAVALVAVCGAVAFYYANYLIYAFFLTNAVLLYYSLAAGQDVSGPALRLAATLIGIAFAFGGTALLTHGRTIQSRCDTDDVRGGLELPRFG